jgi:hypothetical protein
VLPVDHPWWDEHYPPCGWRCRCWPRQITRLEAREIGVTESPPSGPPRRFFNPSTGATVEVPHGIDPGFGYNVGKASLAGRDGPNAAKVMADKMAATPPAVAAVPLPAQVLADQTREFGDWVGGMDMAKPKGDVRVAGALSRDVLSFLATPAIGKAPQSGAITISDHAVAHIMRDSKGELRPPMATMLQLPALLARPSAILWDRDKANLVYVIELAGQHGTRLVVELDTLERARDAAGKRQQIRTNAIVNGQVIDIDALRDRRRYELIDGQL